MKKSLFAGITTALVMPGGTATISAPMHTSGRGNLSTLDRQFLKKSDQSNLGELALSPIVLKRATNTQDKQYAQKMIQDHTKNEELVKDVAAGVGYRIPASTSKEEKGVMHRLSREPMKTFASAYRAEMIRDHTIDIAEARREISLGHNVKVRQYAQQTLTVLKMHLKMARALPTSSAMTGGMNGASGGM